MLDGKQSKLPEPLNRLQPSDRSAERLCRGEVVFTQNEPTRGIYYLIEGIVVMTRVTESGRSIVLHRAHAGDTFAEASLFSSHYHCTATAMCHVLLVRCRLSGLQRLLHEDPVFVRGLAERFALDVQQSRRQIERLSIPVAEERILVGLEDGLLGDDISAFADMIGLAPETVYRALSRLTKSGRVRKLARGHYEVVFQENRQ